MHQVAKEACWYTVLICSSIVIQLFRHLCSTLVLQVPRYWHGGLLWRRESELSCIAYHINRSLKPYSCQFTFSSPSCVSISANPFKMATAADRMSINSQIEHLQAKYVGTGHADLTRFEWALNIHRDSYASFIGHHNMLAYFATVQNESIGRVKYDFLQKVTGARLEVVSCPRNAGALARSRHAEVHPIHASSPCGCLCPLPMWRVPCYRGLTPLLPLVRRCSSPVAFPQRRRKRSRRKERRRRTSRGEGDCTVRHISPKFEVYITHVKTSPSRTGMVH